MSELDKLYLTVKSDKFRADVGNLEITEKAEYGRPLMKQVSGMTAQLNTYHASLKAAVARPRGTFKSVKFNGADRNQGPYRIYFGSAINPIVPGSERIWLDGQLLERGSDKDYIMDYPGSSVTFTARRPIDSRSRIEIDFEPVTENYDRLYYNFGGGAALDDSLATLSVNFLHEGDDKNRLESGDLSVEDIARLQTIGDSVAQNYKSGVVPDPTGDYVELTDAFGNVYYEYAGEGNGDYRVNFSAIEAGAGDYVYDGGSVYRYVGPGRGDYLPIVTIPVPSSEDYLESSLAFRPAKGMITSLTVRQSNLDQNLFSTLDDGNNIGRHYAGEVSYGVAPQIDSRSDGFKIGAELIEKNFKAYQRLNRADLDRKYLIPAGLQSSGDDYRASASGVLGTLNDFNVFTDAGYLEYKNQFKSKYGTVAVSKLDKDGASSYILYTRLDARLDSSGMNRDGWGDIVDTRVNVRPVGKTNLETAFKYDRREDEYVGELRGSTEYSYEARLSWLAHSLAVSVYDEDSLNGQWLNRRHRLRGELGSSLTSGPVRSDIFITAQRFTESGHEEDQLLARVGTTYNPIRHNITVSTSYTISDENRYERGITYLEVEPGQGQYILENGQYIPDSEGNFIKIEEVRSDRAAVKSGEKAFQFVYNPSGLYVRLNSNSKEDLLADQSRDWAWLLPFYSNGSKRFQNRSLDYSGELKAFQKPGYYLLNLAVSYNYEDRLLSGQSYKRYDDRFAAQLKQGYGPWLVEQDFSYFEYFSDSYFAVADDIDGFLTGASAIYRVGFGQVSAGVSFRKADDRSGAQSRQVIAELSPILHLFPGGETTIKLSGYRQDLTSTGSVSYRLTDNKNGKYGAIWSVRSDYKMAKDFRFTLTLSGRHSDDNKPRIVGRGEFIAYF